MILIDWDARTPTANPPGFTLTLKTGVTLGLQNRLTALALPISVDNLPPNYLAGRPHSTMSDPFDRTNRIAVLREVAPIVKELSDLKDEIARLDRPITDCVPELVTYKRNTSRGMLRLVVIWGAVLNGVVSKGERIGDWYFIIGLLDELPDLLSDIFKLDSWFEQDAPKRTEVKRAPKAKVDPPLDAAKRAALERVLKEAGLRV